MEYFCRDGIRGVFGRKLTPRLCRAVARLFKDKKVVIGRDTRASGEFIVDIFKQEIKNIKDFGLVSTCEMSFIAADNNADFGIMITASHNDYRYNGIKIFDGNGDKLEPNAIQELDDEIVKSFNRQGAEKTGLTFQDEKRSESAENTKGGLTNWQKHLASKFEHLRGFDDFFVILDCANGSGAGSAAAVFDALKLPYKIINNSPNGFNINDKCGAVYPSGAVKELKKHKNAIGFSFDGDADRCVMCYKGKVFHQDKLIALLAGNRKKIVATIVFNVGVENWLNERGCEIIRTEVGDGFVAGKMKELGLDFGAESSGHTTFFDVWKSNDGLITALKVLTMLKENPNILDTKIPLMPMVHRDIVCDKDFPKYVKDGIIIRKSETENVMRIDAPKNKIKTAISLAENLIKN
ncbi:MAG: hypothetical protein LBH47_00520 [Christensenellaceae bacterium]|jgi:phosphoglucosamine mutase|nr:hypothetical protein [Christensenellaceae bacterium]